MPGVISGILLVAVFATVAVLCAILAVCLVGASSARKGS
jgi:hypothetical protein